MYQFAMNSPVLPILFALPRSIMAAAIVWPALLAIPMIVMAVSPSKNINVAPMLNVQSRRPALNMVPRKYKAVVLPVKLLNAVPELFALPTIIRPNVNVPQDHLPAIPTIHSRAARACPVSTTRTVHRISFAIAIHIPVLMFAMRNHVVSMPFAWLRIIVLCVNVLPAIRPIQCLRLNAPKLELAQQIPVIKLPFVRLHWRDPYANALNIL